VAAFEAENPITSLFGSDGQDLLTGNADGGPYLASWPSNSHYVITLSSTHSGEVDVTPKGGTAVSFAVESGTSLTTGGCDAA
jgi:hypothetical protein